MKILSKFFLCIGLVAHSLLMAQPSLTKEVLQQAFAKLDIEIPIRVLLDEKPASDAQWKFVSHGGFLVFLPDTKQKTVYQVRTIQVTRKDGHFFVNGIKQPSDHLFIIPLQGPVLFEKNIYDGVIALTLYKSTMYVVNHLDLEDYVLSVLPYESNASWPDEVHKAFCIAFRSYGIAMVLQQRALHKKNGCAVPYDIKNTNAHQVYKGRSLSSRYKKIIDQTRHVVLAHKGEPVLAMFDICCGGIVPARKKGIHFSKAPHLKRTYSCNFCKGYQFYKWECTYTLDDAMKALKKEIPELSAIKEIQIDSVDDAHVVQQIKIKDAAKKWHTLSAAKFKLCLKNLKSLCFTVEKQGNSLKISGRGHGHHMGLCQHGAYAMVRKGWNYRSILKFYYPSTIFMKLKKMNYE